MYAALSITKNSQNFIGSPESLEPKATTLYEHYERSSGGLLGRFKRKPAPMLTFQNALAGRHITNQHSAGSRTVAVNDIRGTYNRGDEDFDIDFHPTQRHTQNRWLRVATAFLRGVELPPIELVELDGVYYVKDGHHRISAARAMGFGYLDAIIEIVRTES